MCWAWSRGLLLPPGRVLPARPKPRSLTGFIERSRSLPLAGRLDLLQPHPGPLILVFIDKTDASRFKGAADLLQRENSGVCTSELEARYCLGGYTGLLGKCLT